jgi:hypothetical protein
MDKAAVDTVAVAERNACIASALNQFAPVDYPGLARHANSMGANFLVDHLLTAYLAMFHHLLELCHLVQSFPHLKAFHHHQER